jgi:hypothetical protein
VSEPSTTSSVIVFPLVRRERSLLARVLAWLRVGATARESRPARPKRRPRRRVRREGSAQ